VAGASCPWWRGCLKGSEDAQIVLAASQIRFCGIAKLRQEAAQSLQTLCGDVRKQSADRLPGFAGRRLKVALNPNFAFVFDEKKHFLDLGERERTQQIYLPSQVALLRIQALQGWNSIDPRGHGGLSQGAKLVHHVDRIGAAEEDLRVRLEEDLVSLSLGGAVAGFAWPLELG